MAGKAKHKFSLRQNLDYTWSILALNQDGKKFWYGEYSLQHNAVRWGNSHKNPNRWPQAVERDIVEWVEEAVLEIGNSGPKSSHDSAMLQLMQSAEVNFSCQDSVAEFLGVPIDMLEEIPDVHEGLSMWQIK